MDNNENEIPGPALEAEELNGEYDLEKTLIEFAKLPVEERMKFFDNIYANLAKTHARKTMTVYFKDDENGAPKVVGIEDKNKE